MFDKKKIEHPGKSGVMPIVGIMLILAVRTGFLHLRYVREKNRSKEFYTRQRMHSLTVGLVSYYCATGELPAQLQDLVDNPRNISFVQDFPRLTVDLWGNPIVLLQRHQGSQTEVVVMSCGKDGQPGGKGYNSDLEDSFEIDDNTGMIRHEEKK